MLAAFPKKIEQSYIKKELWQVRIFTSLSSTACWAVSCKPRCNKSAAGAD